MERRQSRRVTGPFEARWSGHSGLSRISDISASGCFVESLTAPAAGEAITLTVRLRHDEPSLTLTGQVAYATPPHGFGVSFTLDETTSTELRRQLELF